MRYRLLTENPFAEIANCTIRPNRDRDRFVTREEAAKVIEACPDAEWRLIFALSRYGGLRCPSEHLALRWNDIDWEHDRFLVRASKTEHHADKGKRLVPIFPELRPYLDQAWEQAKPGAEYVITRHIRFRDGKKDFSFQMEAIIQKAGIVPWPKLFQNLRSTRATELVAAGWPEYKVCKWLGHTEVIARRHYWQVTDDDYSLAAGQAVEPDAALQIALQIGVQRGDATECNPVKGGMPSLAHRDSVTPYSARSCTEKHDLAAFRSNDASNFSKGNA